MPEVEGIRAVTDVTERRQREHASDAERCLPRRQARADDTCRPEGRQQRSRAGERSALGVRARCIADREQSEPAEGEPRARGETAYMRRSDGQCGSERKLPGPGESRVVRRGRRRGGDVDRPHERRAADSGEDDQQPAKPESKQPRQERGPDEVKLLFDRKRPEVQKRRRRLPLREVVTSLPREMNVGGKERRPDAVVDGCPRPDEVEQMVRGDVRHDERQPGCREDAPGTAQIEARE